MYSSSHPAPHTYAQVHATSLFYYLVKLLLTTHTMVDAFGRPIYPLRYVMWTCSVPCMLI